MDSLNDPEVRRLLGVGYSMEHGRWEDGNGEPIRTEVRPVVQPCHPGCEAQFGYAVAPCDALIRTEHYEAHDCGESWCEPTEAWDADVRCRRVPHDTGAHDEYAQPVIWYDSADAPLVYGKTYGVRMRCHFAGAGPAVLFKSVAHPTP